MDSALITILANTGVAGVMLILFLAGFVYPKNVVDDIKAERDSWREAAQAERERAESAVAAAQATRDIMNALQTGIFMNQPQQQRKPPELPPGPQRPHGRSSPGKGKAP